ncbi:hypothetical protein ACFLYT_01190 [Nanoarchaeota archaeon]
MEEASEEYVEEEKDQGDNIYDESHRENQVEDGEISPEEEAFMRGYDEASEYAEDEEE